MGKNYIENSLKHFLKKKVKITLGFVVAFMISGTLGFAEGTTENPLDEMDNFAKAEYYLKGLNSDKNKLENLMGDFQGVTNGTEGIKLDTSKNQIIFENFKNGQTIENIEITLNNENISDETAKNIKISLENGIKNIENISTETLINGTNNGILMVEENVKDTEAKGAINGNSINNGIISASYGQVIGENQTAVNNGILAFDKYGQMIMNGNSGTAINNGIMYHKVNDWGLSVAQRIRNSEKGILINNGILINTYQWIESGTNNKVYNYGVIENGYQAVSGISATAYNYGIIKSHKNAAQSSVTSGTEDVFLKNYGLIIGRGQSIGGNTSGNNTAENYGVINTVSFNTNAIYIDTNNKNNKGFNYGTIISDKDDPFNNKTAITNKGLVFLNNHTKGINDEKINVGVNQGIVFDKNGDIINDNDVAQYKGGKQDISNSFTNSKNTAYVTGTENTIKADSQNDIDLSGKVIGTVVKDEMGENEAVFKGTEDLTFENTVITGYFEKSGTLLDMGKNNLTLLGDTKIVASRDNFDLNTVALKINGKLKTVGGAEVAGKIVGDGKIINVAVNEKNGTNTLSVSLKNVVLQNAIDKEGTEDDEIKYLKGNNYSEKLANNYTNITYSELKADKVTLKFDDTAQGQKNKVTFTDNLEIKGTEEEGRKIAIDGRDTKDSINLEFSTLNDNKVQGDILLGNTNDDITVVKNGNYNGIIDMGTGDNDSFTVNGFGQSTTKVSDNHKELGMFNYNLVGVETITLGGGKSTATINRGWHIGEQASISGVDSATLKLDNTELHVEMNNNYGKGNVTTSLDNLAGEGTDLKITTENNAEVKFTVGDKFNVSQKEFTVATNTDITDADISSAVIFNTEKVGDDVKVTVKEADDYNGQLDNYKGIYDAMLGALSNHDDLREAVNYSNESKLVEMITKANDTAEALYTTGYAVTKDIIDTYISVTEDFGRKAGKDEWIAYGKYVDSDTEFDGGKSSKGYDGKINGTVGMIEYGVSDVTSYGAVFGQGDTEVDITGGGKLDGDNSYVGAYMKHTTQTGVNLTANVGYTKSDLNLDLATSASSYNMITSGNSDSTALTFALRGTKDYRISDSVRLQPVVSARYSLINQDAVESRDANFRIDEQDVTIFEGTFGGNVIKDFALGNGVLSLSAGAEFVLTEVSKSEDGRYTLYGKDITLLDEEDIADNRVEGHIGAEFIHENGVGVNAKYEMILTDKGDSDRISAGVSYKF